MRERPVVLLLVANADQRESARRELAALDVCPVAVAADTATEALSFYRPISVVLDEAHAAVAPEESGSSASRTSAPASRAAVVER